MILHSSEPVLHSTPISALRPTQITVGMREVRAKRKSWREREPGSFESFLATHMVPTIVGPGGIRYLIDHHHLALALLREDAPSVFVSTVADLSRIEEDLFWNVMEFHGWTHPFDAKGRRRPYDEIPTTVDKLKDDPYRSLAGALRTYGGFAKDATPFSEFVWADFFRRRFAVADLEDKFEATLDRALEIAKSEAANYLPGWCGAHGLPKSAEAKPAETKPAKAAKKAAPAKGRH